MCVYSRLFALSRGYRALKQRKTEAAILIYDPQGSITYVPLLKTDYWRITLSGLKVKDTTIVSADVSAIVDTGTSLLTGPTDAVKQVCQFPREDDAVLQIQKILGGFEIVQGEYEILCMLVPTLPDIVFTIGGKPWTLKVRLLGEEKLSVSAEGLRAGDLAAGRVHLHLGLHGP